MVCSRYPKENRHYESVLKRKCLRKLKNNVWENKTKWKLMKKADVYHKRKILSKHFYLWLHFLKERIHKNLNVHLAKLHYEDKLKSRGIRRLRQNAILSRMFFRICSKKIGWNCKFRAWHQWKLYVKKRQKINEIKFLADKIRKKRLTVRFFYLWVFRLKEKLELQEAYEKAEEEHATKLKRKSLESWKIYCGNKKLEKISICCHEKKLTRRIFGSWRKYASQKTFCRKKIAEIESFHANYLLREYINRWRIAFEKLTTEKEMLLWEKARRFYEQKLLSKSFDIFKRYNISKKFLKKRVSEFEKRCAVVYLSFYINLWAERKKEKFSWSELEIKATKWRENYLTNASLSKLLEKLRLKERISNAVEYSNVVIRRKAFKKWRQFTVGRINKKLQIENACEFHSEKLRENHFQKWKLFMVLKRRKKMTIAHFENTILSRVFQQWRTFVDDRKMLLCKAATLQLEKHEKMLRNSLNAWKNEINLMKNKMKVANAFYVNSKLRKSFATWRKNSELQSTRKSRYEKNKNVLSDIVLKNSISIWQKQLKVKEKLEKKVRKVKERQNCRKVEVFFRIWRRFVEKMKSLRETAANFRDAYSEIVVDQHLELLENALKVRKTIKSKEELARKMDDKLSARKYLRKWSAFIGWQKNKMAECKNTMEAFGGKTKRREPLIPNYLKKEFWIHQFEEKTPTIVNEETFRILSPLNRRLPVAEYKGMFVSFES